MSKKFARSMAQNGNRTSMVDTICLALSSAESGVIMTTNEQGEPFGGWLLKHTGRDDWIGTLAKQAKSDPRFRAATTPDELRKRLQEAGAEGDHFEALDDAEVEWLSE